MVFQNYNSPFLHIKCLNICRKLKCNVDLHRFDYSFLGSMVRDKQIQRIGSGRGSKYIRM